MIKLDKEISKKILNELLNREWTVFNMRNSYQFHSDNYKLSIAIHKDGGYFVKARRVKFPFWIGLRIKFALYKLIISSHRNLVKEDNSRYFERLNESLLND